MTAISDKSVADSTWPQKRKKKKPSEERAMETSGEGRLAGSREVEHHGYTGAAVNQSRMHVGAESERRSPPPAVHGRSSRGLNTTLTSSICVACTVTIHCVSITPCRHILHIILLFPMISIQLNVQCMWSGLTIISS